MPGLPLQQQQQEAIAFLQKTSSTDGGSIYDHMTDVVMKVSSAYPQPALKFSCNLCTSAEQSNMSWIVHSPVDTQRAAVRSSESSANIIDGQQNLQQIHKQLAARAFSSGKA